MPKLNPIDIYLKFEYFDPRTNAFKPYPEASQVVVMDYDSAGLPRNLNSLLSAGHFTPHTQAIEDTFGEPGSSDDYLAYGLTDADGKVNLKVKTFGRTMADLPGEPDLYFKIAASQTNVSGVPLPSIWSSFFNKDTNGRRGRFIDFSGTQIGAETKPVVYRIKGLNAYLQLHHYDEATRGIKPVPEGTLVQLMDSSTSSSDPDILTQSTTDEQGIAVLTAYLASDSPVVPPLPELYFNINVSDFEVGGAFFTEIPTKKIRDVNGRFGFYEGSDILRLGTLDKPISFVLGTEDQIRVGFVLLTSQDTDTTSTEFAHKIEKLATIQQNFKEEYIFATYGRSMVIGNDDVAVLTIDGDIPSIEESTTAELYLFLKNMTQKLYESHSDIFDHLAIYEDFDGANLSSRHFSVKNDILHIGRPVFNSSSQFGTSGKLRGIGLVTDVNSLPDTYSFSDSEMHLLMHETIAHQYGLFGLEDLSIGTGIHFSHYTSGPAFSYLYTHPWKMTSDGLFTVTVPTTEELESGRFVRFHPLVMYAMGLFSAAEVGPTMLVDTDYDIQHRYDGPADPVEGTATFITIEEIMESWGGPRAIFPLS